MGEVARGKNLLVAMSFLSIKVTWTTAGDFI